MALGERGVSMVPTRIPRRALSFCLEGGTRRPGELRAKSAKPALWHSGNASAPGRHAPP